MENVDKYKVNYLTPVKEYNGVLYKRDDTYMPFEDIPISGGKVRQIISLFQDNLSLIQEGYNNHIVTALSFSSSMGLIISRIAYEFGVKCTLIFGTSNQDNVKDNPMIQKCQSYNAIIDVGLKSGYPNVLLNKLYMVAERENWFIVSLSSNYKTNPKSILDSIAYQVQNLPKDLDYLFIPAGSGINSGSILRGLERYEIKPKNIVIIQIAGHDRTKVIDTMYSSRIDYEYICDYTYPYNRDVVESLNRREFLDPTYEAKAHKYMKKHYDLEGKKVLFWIVGNTLMVK